MFAPRDVNMLMGTRGARWRTWGFAATELTDETCRDGQIDCFRRVGWREEDPQRAGIRLLSTKAAQPVEIPTMDKRTSSKESSDRARDISDEQHDSNRRGEHRYPDAHQKPAERQARQNRDDLKQKLGRRRGR
jgi:hypothetical protein